MSSPPVHIITHSPEETAQLGEAVAGCLEGGEVIALTGELGAGKTCFAKGLAHGLGIDPDLVTSPTFILINEYHGRLHVYHFDAYRLKDGGELEALGCDEMFAGSGVCVVEWADRVEDCLPPDRLAVRMAHAGPTSRSIDLVATGEKHRGLLVRLPC